MKLHFPIYYNDFSRSKVRKKVKVFCHNECRFESVYHVLEILYFGCIRYHATMQIENIFLFCI